jgi:ABC-type multidrug transport system ATPase subunit
MITPDPLIDVAGLAKSYGGRSVVRDVTMRLLPGEMIGLVGANGGGKTTTLRMLAGLLRPDAGSGMILKDDIFSPRPDRRHRIGYMGQRPSLYPDLGVSENLRFHGAVHGLADPVRRISKIVEQYGLGDVLHQPFGHLSGGWARRVQFATAILHSPPLLLLDEPTAGLDAVTKRNIWRWLGDLASAGHGIVISTHDLSEAGQCSRIALYHDGCAYLPRTPAALISETAATSLEIAIMRLVEAQPA